MVTLLKFLIAHFSQLFDDYGFAITQSENSGNRFHGASILLRSKTLEIFFAFERDQFSAEFRSVEDKRKGSWYSVATILAYLGHKNCLGIFDKDTLRATKQALPQIVTLFEDDEIENILSSLDQIERTLAKNE